MWGQTLSVYFGITKYGSFSEKMQVIASDQYIYPGYNESRKANDIGLLHGFSFDFEPIPLKTPSYL